MEPVSGLMTIDECAEFAGVSIDTVKQYAEFGLLSVVEKEGSRLFKEADVATIFHLTAVKPYTRKEKPKHVAEVESSDAETINRENSSGLKSCQLVQDNIISLHDEIEVTTASQGQYASGESLRIVELLQLNQSLREQLDMVREDRDWLRARLERLEARSEREQMLLLSESETVRSLINQQNGKKRSFWTFALPWNNSQQ